MYDLVGNRVQYTLSMPNNPTMNETVTSMYDANDRLKQELSSLGSTTMYGYDQTQETSQIVRQADGSSVTTLFTYDLQGNMKTAEVDRRSSSGTLVSREVLTYGYDANGIRVSALDQIDSNGSGSWAQQTLTQYLNDPQNFTGYSQVLRETDIDPNTGQVITTIEYTFGSQQISQTVITYSSGEVARHTTNVFGHDAHESVRVLTDMTAAIAQIYRYDGYGNMEAIYSENGQFVSRNPADAVTVYLYSGYRFDVQIGTYYLRARNYDPGTGTMLTEDPIFGHLSNPQTFNKYLYVAGDPINAMDPTGRDLVEMMVSLSLSSTVLQAPAAGAVQQAVRLRFLEIGGGWGGRISFSPPLLDAQQGELLRRGFVDAGDAIWKAYQVLNDEFMFGIYQSLTPAGQWVAQNNRRDFYREQTRKVVRALNEDDTPVAVCRRVDGPRGGFFGSEGPPEIGTAARTTYNYWTRRARRIWFFYEVGPLTGFFGVNYQPTGLLPPLQSRQSIVIHELGRYYVGTTDREPNTDRPGWEPSRNNQPANSNDTKSPANRDWLIGDINRNYDLIRRLTRGQ
jgi:RHS repeat-associated protein